jgi:hypothetical protein
MDKPFSDWRLTDKFLIAPKVLFRIAK